MWSGYRAIWEEAEITPSGLYHIRQLRFSSGLAAIREAQRGAAFTADEPDLSGLMYYKYDSHPPGI